MDDTLLIKAKTIAAESGRTLTAVIEDALKEAIYRRGDAAGDGKTELTTVGGRGLCPGVDLDRTADLLDLMENN